MNPFIVSFLGIAIVLICAYFIGLLLNWNHAAPEGELIPYPVQKKIDIFLVSITCIPLSLISLAYGGYLFFQFISHLFTANF